jgi:hypothetical protein
MQISSPFYIIVMASAFGQTQYFDAPSGLWSGVISEVQRYATSERAVVDCQEFDLCTRFPHSTIQVVPYKECVGHDGNTIILPA